MQVSSIMIGGHVSHREKIPSPVILKFEHKKGEKGQKQSESHFTFAPKSEREESSMDVPPYLFVRSRDNNMRR